MPGGNPRRFSGWEDVGDALREGVGVEASREQPARSRECGKGI